MGRSQSTRQILSNDQVRLSEDLPGLRLHEGDVGVVRSAWHYPNVAFEVEFRTQGTQGAARATRVLLLEDQVRGVDEDEDGACAGVGGEARYDFG